MGEEEEKVENKEETFSSLGLHSELVKSCEEIGWTRPTKIQALSIPNALNNKDIIGLAETGSGKTGAFCLPILHKLLEAPSYYYACIVTPTRELAFQINQVLKVLGTTIGLKTVCITGGVNMIDQAIQLMKPPKPHIIISTPGRLVDHLENTKGFNLQRLKVFVLDEADKMLSMDFETEINLILGNIPKKEDRQTFLYSATITSKLNKLQLITLNNPIQLSGTANENETSVTQEGLIKTVKTLKQNYIFIPSKFKEYYLVYILKRYLNNKLIIFCNNIRSCDYIAALLKYLSSEVNLDFSQQTREEGNAILDIGSILVLHSKLAQNKRLNHLSEFKKDKKKQILVCTNILSRGIDIAEVDFILNYDIPTNSKEYVHRVGRTARNGKYGRALSIVTQYDIELFQNIEKLLKFKLEESEVTKELSKQDKERLVIEKYYDDINNAKRLALNEVNQLNNKKRGIRKKRGKGNKQKRKRFI